MDFGVTIFATRTCHNPVYGGRFRLFRDSLQKSEDSFCKVPGVWKTIHLMSENGSAIFIENIQTQIPFSSFQFWQVCLSYFGNFAWQIVQAETRLLLSDLSLHCMYTCLGNIGGKFTKKKNHTKKNSSNSFEMRVSNESFVFISLEILRSLWLGNQNHMALIDSQLTIYCFTIILFSPLSSNRKLPQLLRIPGFHFQVLLFALQF